MGDKHKLKKIIKAVLWKIFPFSVLYRLNFARAAYRQLVKGNITAREFVCFAAFGSGKRHFCINRLVVVLGTRCSLRCRECNNLMPRFVKQSDLRPDMIKRSIREVLKNVQAVLSLELVGGEPFLSDNLRSILEYVLRSSKVKEIEITTNATVLPKDDIIPLLQSKRVLVRISDYGSITEDARKRMISILDEKSIRYNILDLGDWMSPGGVDKRQRDYRKLRELYKYCGSSYYCKTLFEDKIFSCSRASSLAALGYMKEREYLQVSETISTGDIIEFFMRDYSIACDYCDIAAPGKPVEPGEQI